MTRWRCLNHRTNGATAEDSGVDAVAGMRRDKDYGATTFESELYLTSLLPTPHNPKGHGRDNLLQTAVDGCEGRRGATKTSGPDDPKPRRRRPDVDSSGAEFLQQRGQRGWRLHGLSQ